MVTKQETSWRFVPGRQFSSFASAWRNINQRGTKSPILDPDFVQAGLLHFGQGNEVLALMERGGEIVAMGVLRRKNPFIWETFQPSQAPVGAWVVLPQCAMADVTCSLLLQLPGLPLLLGITQIDPELFARPESRNRVRTVDYIQTACISINGTFEGYWNARGKNLRQNMKRQRNLLQRENIASRLDVLTQPEDMAEAIAVYGRMESSGWKASGGTAIAPDNDQGKFYIQLLQSYAARQQAHVYRYWYDNRIVAMDLCISNDGVIVILKTTYDEKEQATSPAMLMRQDTFKEFFDRGPFRRIEFYGKLMEWHTRWSSEIRTMYHVNTYRWASLAALLTLRWPAAE